VQKTLVAQVIDCDLVRRAGLTRGAAVSHFFSRVVEVAQREVCRRRAAPG
jgi:hypothetical protein